MKNRKGFAPIVLIVAAAILFIAAGAWYYEMHRGSSPATFSTTNSSTENSFTYYYETAFPNDFLLVNSEGRRTGWNSETYDIYNEIPSVTYNHAVGCQYPAPSCGSNIEFSPIPNEHYTLYLLNGGTRPYSIFASVSGSISTNTAVTGTFPDYAIGAEFAQNPNPINTSSFSPLTFEGFISSTIVMEPASSTPPQTSLSPAGSQLICYSSTQGISTSTWKAFKDPHLSITFQYPPDWKIDPNWPYPTLSGDGMQLYIKTMSEVGSGLVPTGADEPYYCSKVFDGQNVVIGAYTGVVAANKLSRVLSIQYGQQWWGIVFSSDPSIASTTDPVFYKILETISFK